MSWLQKEAQPRMVLSTVSPASIEAEQPPPPHHVQQELMRETEEREEYF